MQWLEPIRNLISVYGYDIAVTLGIAALAAGLAIGVVRRSIPLREHKMTIWQGTVMLALLALILMGGLAGIIVLSGLDSAIILIATLVIVFAVVTFIKPNLVTDWLVTNQLQNLHSNQMDNQTVEMEANDVVRIHGATRDRASLDALAKELDTGIQSTNHTNNADGESAVAVGVEVDAAPAMIQIDEQPVQLRATLTKRPALGKSTIQGMRRIIN